MSKQPAGRGTRTGAGRVRGPRDARATSPSPTSPSASYQGLSRAGLSPTEAGNVTAWLHGLPMTRGGWTIREIGHLQFLRQLVDEGRIAS